jgi:hypothetical protein
MAVRVHAHPPGRGLSARFFCSFFLFRFLTCCSKATRGVQKRDNKTAEVPSQPKKKQLVTYVAFVFLPAAPLGATNSNQVRR